MRSTISTILAIGIAVSCTVGDEAEHDDILDLDNALLVSSRDRLEVCLQVQPALAAQAVQLADRLRDDLALLRAHHPDWQIAGVDDFVVVIGCPASATVAQPIDDKGTAGVVVGPGLQAKPSPFRVHVHVISDATATTVLGARSFARAIAELAVVDDHRVAEVSTALIVRVTALGSDGFRDDALAQSIGLRVGI